MKKYILGIVLTSFISCGVNDTEVNNTEADDTNFSSFWVEKGKENDRIIIKKNGKNYLVESKNKRYAAQVKDGLLEISFKLPMKATIDKDDILVIGGDEYIRIEKSKTYHLAKFEDCSLGDYFHLTFDGIEENFGANHRYNKYGDYKLCIEDNERNTIPNPKYVGKEFIIRWDMKSIRAVLDPTDPFTTSWVKRPRITFLKLKE